MGRTHGADADGRRVDLIGKPVAYRLAPIPRTGVGVRMIGQQEAFMAEKKAPSNGTYKDADGNQFVIREGDVLPEGAAFNAEEADIVVGTKAQPVGERSLTAAPENKSRKAAPEAK